MPLDSGYITGILPESDIIITVRCPPGVRAVARLTEVWLKVLLSSFQLAYCPFGFPHQ